MELGKARKNWKKFFGGERRCDSCVCLCDYAEIAYYCVRTVMYMPVGKKFVAEGIKK